MLISYVNEKATVSLAGQIRVLTALFKKDRTLGDEIHVRGLAFRFPRGRKVWEGNVTFRFKDGTWQFLRAQMLSGPPSIAPLNLMGFLADCPARDRSVAGFDRWSREDRAAAGQPGGPRNAAEVGCARSIIET